jgi:hypothetical protein
MKRTELEHIIRAVAAITNRYEVVVIGSQSILGAAPGAPDSLLQSMEADIYCLPYDEALSDLIDGSIGEESPFHALHGYYAQGVGPETAVLPAGWQERLVKVQNQNTDLKIGYCLDPTDLAASKLAAGREKDGPFVATLLSTGLIEAQRLQERLLMLPLDAQRIQRMVQWVATRSTG